MFPAITSIESQRLVIRPIAGDDLADLLEVNGDPNVTAFLPYPTWQSLADGVAWLARMDALAASGSGQQLVLVRKADAKVIGTLLLFRYEKPSQRVELGYVLGRAHWRQGLVREAVVAVCTLAFGSLNIRRIEAEVNPANVASCQLLQGLGFVHEGTLRQRWVGKGAAYHTNLYGCLAGEWGESPHGRALPRLGNGVALRRLCVSDLAAFQAYRSDAELGRYQGWTAMPDAQARAFLAEMNTAPLFRPGEWAQIGIAAPGTLELIGDIGLVLAEDARHVEIGFTLARHAQGRGLATAAVHEAVQLAFEFTDVESVLCVTDARNLASIAVLERLGMRRQPDVRNTMFRGEPCTEYVYVLPRG